MSTLFYRTNNEESGCDLCVRLFPLLPSRILVALDGPWHRPVASSLVLRAASARRVCSIVRKALALHRAVERVVFVAVLTCARVRLMQAWPCPGADLFAAPTRWAGERRGAAAHRPAAQGASAANMPALHVHRSDRRLDRGDRPVRLGAMPFRANHTFTLQ